METQPIETMIGVVLDAETGQPVCSTLPKVDIRHSPGTACVRVTLAGICATDLALVKGYKNTPRGLVLGHEFVGVIESINPYRPGDPMTLHAPAPPAITPLSVGTRVCAEINCTDPGSCTDWKQRAQHPERTALGIFGAHGAFAEFVQVPIENLHAVPDHVPDHVAVFTEPLAAACQVLEENHVQLGSKVAVLGAGRLGTLVAAVLAASQHDVVVLVRPAQDDALHSLGHLTAITSRNVKVQSAAAIPDTYDCIVECTGSPSGLGRALELIKPRGTIILKSTYPVGAPQMAALDLATIVVKEIKLVGSRCGPFQVALRMLSEGVITPQVLISEQYFLSEAKQAFHHAGQSKALKILLRPDHA